jgi:hypothetical protein
MSRVCQVARRMVVLPANAARLARCSQGSGVLPWSAPGGGSIFVAAVLALDDPAAIAGTGALVRPTMQVHLEAPDAAG